MEVSGGSRRRWRWEKLPGRRKLLTGEEVEVLSLENGLVGSWHTGTVIACEELSRLIEFKYFVTEEENTNLQETVTVSPVIEGQAARNPVNYRGRIRPLPPYCDLKISVLRFGLCVDAWIDEAWWEGVVFDHQEGSEVRLIFFPDQGDQQMVTVDHLRLTQDWREPSGNWESRGEWLLLKVLQPFEGGGVLPVSVRQIWYDLSTLDAFSERIGLWMLGSESVWDHLVTGLIQDLLLVVHGLLDVPYDNADGPVSTGTTKKQRKKKVKGTRSTNCQGPFKPLLAGAGSPPEEALDMQNLLVCSSSNKRKRTISSTYFESDNNKDAKISNDRCLTYSKLADDSHELDSDITKLHSAEFCEDEQQSDNSVSGKENLKLNVSVSVPTCKDVEPEYHPDAIVNYKRYIESSRVKGCQRTANHDIGILELNAWKHLLYMGWNFGERRRRSRYSSPDGEVFYSLYTACQAYLCKKENLWKIDAVYLTDSNDSQTSSLSKDLSCYQNLKKRKRYLTGKADEPDTGMFPSDQKSSKSHQQKCLREQEEGTALSLLIDNHIVSDRQKVHYICEWDGEVKKEGYITRTGIKCKCCKELYTVVGFEIHSSSNKCKPGARTFLLDGMSLLQCKSQLVYGKDPIKFSHPRLKHDSTDSQSDDTCSLCHGGGTLILCDACPSTFHVSCIGLEEVPEGKWFCSCCLCCICGSSEFNSAEIITQKTILYCDQCQSEYHVGCLTNQGISVSDCATGNWFCSSKCSQIFLHLRNLVGKPNLTTKRALTWTILHFERENVALENCDFETFPGYWSKLHAAYKLLHECFTTMIEPRTQSDLLYDIIMNKESELRRLNFWGFYTIILENGDDLVSVATFRVHTEKVAELPFVGTTEKYRRQGMCHILVEEIEKLLSDMGVERLCLPAVLSLVDTWTTSFGFSKMTDCERLQHLLDYSLLTFPGTTMCQKILRATP
ncbi:uncharacterized protein LOC121971356 isoform X1 [Zingiber officinale]|uniref:uncharacterized protein LOC121971356 isoform X1 n=1 Tax=Zingiber officinale TaxID=94328 RepID=UPI001C4B1B06|nr:uncharacterized protein LOC121971356 isoform X1 [Zingiber officinale]